jgi:DNA mismatch endonuclease (patch repair protein)
MADKISSARRSEIMSHIRSKGMVPEMRVRRLIHHMGFRYRLHGKNLPGRPDLVFPGRRKVIFVHGCFWHQHANCSISRIPKSNKAYWKTKLAKNVERDKEHQRRLKELGWQVLIIWECTIRDVPQLQNRIRQFLEG